MDPRHRDNEQAIDDTAELPASVAELRALFLQQQRRLEQQPLFIDQLLEQIRLARHKPLGARSERFSIDQMALVFNEAEAAARQDPEAEEPDILGTVAVLAHRRAKYGRLRIDNNLTENLIRPFVIGRKNFLFCDTVAGANASANLYSLIETAKANKIEPYAYLRTVFTELPLATSVDEIEALLPNDSADSAQVS